MPISLDFGYANLFMNLAMKLKHFLGAQSSGYPVLERREQQECGSPLVFLLQQPLAVAERRSVTASDARRSS